MASAASFDGLARASPESRGVKSADILAFLKEAKDLGVTFNSFMLYRRSAVICEGWWYPYEPKLPHMTHSATKSFTTVAVGLAIQEGYFSITDRVLSFFPEQTPDEPSENLKAMTVEHLLTQTSGHTTSISGGSWRGIKSSWIEEFFKVPVTRPPGTHFQYSSATSYMLSAMVQRTTGKSALDFLLRRMLQPMGIRDLRWQVGPDGVNPGGNGISCHTSDLLKLAILFLNQGKWEGRQLLAKEYALDACRPHFGNQYGYQWWIGEYPGSFYAYGLFGQFAIVIPEYDAILVTTASEPWGESVLRSLIWRRLPGIFDSTTPDVRSGSYELRSYLSELRVLPPFSPHTHTDHQDLSDRLFVTEANIDNIEAFTLDFEDDRAVVHIWDHRGIHRVDIGLKSWLTSETSVTCAPLHHGYEAETTMVVAGGRWSAPDVFEMTWQFPETAFQDRVVIRVAGDAALFERGVNVNSFATQRPPIAARILDKGTGCSAGLNVKKKVAKALQLTDFSKMQLPARTVPFSVVGTSIGELLDRADTRTVLQEVLPIDLLNHPRMQEARSYAPERLSRTMASFSSFASLSDTELQTIEARLKGVPLDTKR
ncbi:hypothetical protein H2200_002649 [Cladophialophora chaetospira]|uniref:Beta-lactamase-related domain-containing protein n=1 Tax=Cladophialophora chaetospira TaxID=386627 RepID=A0AA39CN97_9EURO|nr:hypothetical protein H2200_002649 [Cladophialophora chaetospira]